MDQNIDTGGGFYVEGGASAGKNFTGRDSVAASNVEQIGDRIIVNPATATDRQMLEALYLRMTGDPVRNIPSLIGNVENVVKAVDRLTATNEKQQQENAQYQASIESQIASLYMLFWVTLSAIGIVAVFEILLLIRVFGSAT